MKTTDDGNLRSFEALLEDEQEAPVTLDTSPDVIRRSIATLRECLPEGARLMLSGVIERDGTVGVFSEDPLFHVEITLYGGPKP